MYTTRPRPSLRTTWGLLLGLIFPVVAVLPGAASASSATEVVAALDIRANLAKTQFFEYEVINEEKGREGSIMRLQVSLSGEERFTEFLAPGDMKGTRVLVKNRAQMYVYLPAYNKVRRIASHTTSGGFMGTTYSNDDMATSSYGPVYDFSMASEDDSSWVVSGPPKEGVKVAYGKIEITIAKANSLPTTFRYFNKDGVHVKTEVRSRYSCSGEVCNAESMKMTDHTRGDASTELLRRDWKVNPELPSSMFSVRNLQP